MQVLVTAMVMLAVFGGGLGGGGEVSGWGRHAKLARGSLSTVYIYF